MRQIWAFHVSSAKIESGLGVRCPPFSAHFRGTIWSPRPKQRRCAGRRPPTRGVAPPAARGRVFVGRRTLCAAFSCVTVDRASARTLWWVE
eukprot:scaffold32239_cov94-Phaeocystis_antarctica.AAC.2